MNKAVFLDRDGVLVEDADLLTTKESVRVLAGVPEALSSLRTGGYQLVVVSNQTVVSRGLLSEADVVAMNEYINSLVIAGGGAGIDAFYFCPHHPSATLEAYRKVCDCRKPMPGMLLQAARERGIDLARSFMVGDRVTDIIAGAKAGCRTILVQTGKHTAPPIETAEPLETGIKPDFVCRDLPAAAAWILKGAE